MEAQPGHHHSVASNLEALVLFLSPLRSAGGQQDSLLLHLQSTALRWNCTAPEEVSAALAAESCESIVSVFRLLSDASSRMSGPTRTVANACAFLALAGTVQAFEEARDLLVPGQVVTISALQSEAGLRLNGAQGVVQRFHAESGRFIVRMQPEDPPSEWKKLRPLNLVPVDAGAAGQSLALEGARECGRACLEAVAEVFDDLLHEMHAEADEGQEEDLCITILHAHLSAAMWEALVVCCGDGGLQLTGSALLDLCGGDMTLCSLFARHVMSAHLAARALAMSDLQEARAVRRLHCLQESFARAYCGLYQPAALWGGRDPGDLGIADLQAVLDSHVQQLAVSSAQLGALATFIDAVDFHIAWASSGEGGGICPVPLVLPVLLSRLVCTVLASTSGAEGARIQRHIMLLSPSLLSAMVSFAELVCQRLTAKAAASSDLLLASQAVLDCLVALAGHGLLQTERNRALAEAVAREFLSCLVDPALLARLVLTFLRRSEAEDELRELLASGLRALPAESEVVFWQQIRSRARLQLMAADEAQALAQEWLGEVSSPQALAACASSSPQEINHQMDSFIDKCMQQLPRSLKEPDLAGNHQDLGSFGSEASAAVAAIAALEASPGGGAIGERLNALDLPGLPGQCSSKKEAALVNGRHRLARNDVARIRGVDATAAPQDLCCAIDGKLLGAPIKSPYGHVFERETLQQWIGSCGSICPITGKPLRAEDCLEDEATERKVFEWVKSAKAAHKLRVQEKRSLRGGKDASRPDASVLL